MTRASLSQLDHASEEPDLHRPVVCPDSGEAFADATQAARVLRGRGWQDAESRDVLRAIASGNEYCGHYFDWKWPPGVESVGKGD